MRDQITPCYLNIIIIYSNDGLLGLVLLLEFIQSSSNCSSTEYFNSWFSDLQWIYVCALIFLAHVNFFNMR